MKTVGLDTKNFIFQFMSRNVLNWLSFKQTNFDFCKRFIFSVLKLNRIKFFFWRLYKNYRFCSIWHLYESKCFETKRFKFYEIIITDTVHLSVLSLSQFSFCDAAKFIWSYFFLSFLTFKDTTYWVSATLYYVVA